MSIINFNHHSNEYKYDLSVIEKDEWLEFAEQLIYENIGWIKSFELLTYKVSIVGNIAKIKLAFSEKLDDGKQVYHESKFKLDEFGKISTNYKDATSRALQLYMFNHYGDEYYYSLLEKQMEVSKTL